MITHRIPIPNSRNNVQWALSGDIHRIFPPRIQIIIDDACLRYPLLVFIGQDHVRITASVHVTGFQILGLHHLDREDISGRFANLLELGWCVLCNHIGTCVDVDLLLESI